MRRIFPRLPFAVIFNLIFTLVIASPGLAFEALQPAPLQEFFHQEFNKRLVEAFNKCPLACAVKNESCGSFDLIGREPLDQYEREEALRLVRIATLGTEKEWTRMHDPQKLAGPLSGLSACCGETTCRDMMLEQKVRLKNSSDSKTER